MRESPLRILYLCRVFSGLETSLLSGRWQPTGAPTIYKVMERLAASSHDVRYVLPTKGVGREYRTAWRERRDRALELTGFSRPLTVLAGEHRFPTILGRLRGILTTIIHLGRLVALVARFRPQLVYVDRGNVLGAALIARMLKVPVVLRVMGVYPSMWQTLKGWSPQDWVYRWAYRSPFALTICTEDGTPGRGWLEQALLPSVPRAMMLNGIAASRAPDDVHPQLASLPQGRVIILFVGRFESYKGCDLFVEAAIRLASMERDRIHAVMVGTGSRHADIVARVQEAGASSAFTFIERLPHSQIGEAHARADIYVSLNRLGQLSNANLEAMLAGACLVMPSSRPEDDVDVATDALVPADAAVRLPEGEDECAALVTTLARLVNTPDERMRLSARMAEVARGFVRTWDERVDEELKLIERAIGVKL